MNDALSKRARVAARPSPPESASASDHLDRWTGDPDFMLSLAKGLLVLQAVAGAGRRTPTTELAAVTGLSRPAVRRCVYTMSALGYLLTDDLGAVAGPRLAALTSAYVSSSPFIAASGPILGRLRDRTRESASLWVFDGLEAIYVARADGARRFAFNIQIGARRAPLYCTSIGRVLLAFRPRNVVEDYLARTELAPRTEHTVTSPERLLEILAEIRRQGYAVGDQEAEIGLRSITAAVRDSRGEVVGALNVGTQAAVVGKRELRSRILPPLIEAAAELTALLTSRPSRRERTAALPSPPKGPSAAGRLNAWAGDPSFMMSLARGLLVLHAVAAEGRSLPLPQIASVTGLSRATTRRCAYTLNAQGYLLMDASGAVSGPRLTSLTAAYISTSPLITGSGPILERLRGQVCQTASLWAFSGDEAIYVSHTDEEGLFKITFAAGARAPLYCTSIGRTFLAFRPANAIKDYLAQTELAPLTERTVTSPEQLVKILAAVRRQGYAIVDQEVEAGLRSISVPVRNGRGDVVAAISIGTQPALVGLQDLRIRILPPLIEAAAELSALLP